VIKFCIFVCVVREILWYELLLWLRFNAVNNFAIFWQLSHKLFTVHFCWFVSPHFSCIVSSWCVWSCVDYCAITLRHYRCSFDSSDACFVTPTSHLSYYCRCFQRIQLGSISPNLGLQIWRQGVTGWYQRVH